MASTNLYAAAILKDKQPEEGTVVLTDYQYAGRGQRSNTWHASPGESLTCSIILYPAFLQPSQQFYLNKAISLGLRKFIEKTISTSTSIKWPNDLLVKGNKISGILIENTLWGQQIHHSIAGIGINVFQRTFPPNLPSATSCWLENPHLPPMNILQKNLWQNLDKYYNMLKQESFDQLDQEYLTHLFGYRALLKFRTKEGEEFSGKISNVEESGLLIVAGEDGKRRQFGFKEVEFLMD